MKPIEDRYQIRRGLAVVEFAVLLPLVALLLFGTIEIARAVMVTHALQEAAQAGCRVYSVEGTTPAQVTAIIDQALSQAGIDEYSISFDPATKTAIDVPKEPVTVSVSTSFASVAWLPPNFLAGATLGGRCVMPADLDISDGGDSNGYTLDNDDNDTDGIPRFENRDDDGDDDDD